MNQEKKRKKITREEWKQILFMPINWILAGIFAIVGGLVLGALGYVFGAMMFIAIICLPFSIIYFIVGYLRGSLTDEEMDKIEKLKEELTQANNLLGLFFLVIGLICLFIDHYEIAGIGLMAFGLGIIIAREIKDKQ